MDVFRKNKDAELKKKEAITISLTSWAYTSGNTTTTETYSGFDGKVILIDQLKKKEIVLIDNSSNTDSDGYVNSTNITTTLIAK